jgi:hypothetical protein
MCAKTEYIRVISALLVINEHVLRKIGSSVAMGVQLKEPCNGNMQTQ